MGYCRQTALPAADPLLLLTARSFLRLPRSFTSEDELLTSFLQAAREQGELLTGRALAKRTFTQVLDSHPYYSDAMQSRQAYPPNYYLWNHTQVIKLGFSPVISVEQMRSVNPDGTIRTMLPHVDFVLDRISEPARIFPLPGQHWPPDLYVANALQIDFTAGYDPDPTAVDTQAAGASGQQPASTIVTGVPQWAVLGILNLAAYWWNNRSAAGTCPADIEKIFLQHAIQDWAPTAG
jgi:uncharacterized phiE125 gp8 family phage protein